MDTTPKKLPLLRADLEITLAPKAEDGKPMWMLHDPVSASFTQVNWMQFEIVKRLNIPQTLEQLLERLNNETTLRETPEEIKEFIGELIKADLTTQTLYKTPDNLTKLQEARKQGLFKWLIFHYLYFRVKIIQPDDFLERLLGYSKYSPQKFSFFSIL